MGRSRRVVHTPGHRPEHMVIAVIDGSRGPEPWIVLVGDSPFIGDVPRPDLAIDGREGARSLHDSVHQRLLLLAEGTLVYPGPRRRFALRAGRQPDDRNAAHSSGAIILMVRIVELNRGAEPPQIPEARPLSAEAVRELIDQGGAAVLDLRSPDDFAAGHIPGAISVPLRGGQFQNRIGSVVSAEATLVLVTGSDAEAEQAVRALAVIGHDRVAGYLAGGMVAWEKLGYGSVSLPVLMVRELWDRMSREPSLQVLDVREAAKWAAGHVARASTPC